ncbi:MAG: glycosyltransferase family 4 protein [Pseudomonadota bacterium]
MSGAVFAIPGRLDTPTGGYEYARRLLAEAGRERYHLAHWPLPPLGLAPDGAAIDGVAERLARAPAGWPMLIDGLAGGVLPAALFAELGGPVVALCHHPLALETGIDTALAERLRESERAMLAAASAVITTSAATAGILARDFGVEPDRITVAPPGTERPEPRPACLAREGREEVWLLAVGTLSPRKGHDVLLEALATLPREGWRLTILGAADLDPDHAAHLEARAEALGLTERVRFRGAADRETLEDHYARADLFVLASRYEGYGMAYTEAMARGLPVLGSEVGAVREATLDAALLVPPGDPEALAAALSRLIGSVEERRALAERCRAAAARLPRWSDTWRQVATTLDAVRADGP